MADQSNSRYDEGDTDSEEEEPVRLIRRSARVREQKRIEHNKRMHERVMQSIAKYGVPRIVSATRAARKSDPKGSFYLESHD
jgi:hypothetical protein